jgi:hypothetical protein
MAVSLGMRISGLLVAGAVAVAAAAFTGDGRGSADGRGGGDTIVIAGPSGGPRSLLTGPTGGSAPPVRPSPDGHLSGPGSTDTPSGPPSGGASENPRPSPTPSPSGSGPVVLQAPPWLPPGPDSPDSDGTPDPASVYDRLRAPSECRSALGLIPQQSANEEWHLLHGLAAACLAVQGRGGSWDTATADHAVVAGRVDTCKGRAAYTVLGGLLDFHRRHPNATVRLTPAVDGTPACGYRVAGVDTGGDGTARPGDTIGIELADTSFDHAELLRYGSVTIGGRQVPGVPVPTSDAGDRLTLSVVVPALDPGPVEVAVRYADTEARLPSAFTVTAPDVVPEPSTDTEPIALSEGICGSATPQRGAGLSSMCGYRRVGATSHNEPAAARQLIAALRATAPPAERASRPPQRMLPLRPLPAHRPRP